MYLSLIHAKREERKKVGSVDMGTPLGQMDVLRASRIAAVVVDSWANPVIIDFRLFD